MGFKSSDTAYLPGMVREDLGLMSSTKKQQLKFQVNFSLKERKTWTTVTYLDMTASYTGDSL